MSLPHVDSPPLAPLSPEQERFLWLHDRHLVNKTVFVMGGAQVRAFTERGHTATISATALAELNDMGLTESYGPGTPAVKLTAKGKERIK